MNRLYCIATAAAAIGLVSLPASGVLAQGTAAGAAAAPAAGAAAPATTAAPAAPQATTTTTPAPAAAAPTTDKSSDDKGKKKTASKKGSQSELDRSVDSKTVPSRYKSQMPKEYHGYIPWGR